MTEQPNYNPPEANRLNTRYFIPLERVTAVERTATGILAHVDDELLRVDVIRDDIIRLKISRGAVFDETPTYAVCGDLTATPASFSVEERADAVQIRTAHMSIVVNLSPFRLAAYRADGSVIFAPPASGWEYATLNDAFVMRRACRAADGILGLGEKTGRLNRKGEDYILWNNDVFDPNSERIFAAGRNADDPRADRFSTGYDPYYVSIPFFYHMTTERNDAAGFFIDNSYRAHFDFSPRTSYAYHFSGGQYTEYVFAGPGIPAILEGYTWLTGRMAAPPLWALGYHQCRWYPYNNEALETLAAEQRKHNIPCDVLWLDIDYMDGYRVFTWNKHLFPDPAAMLARLRANGFRTITIIDPGVKYDPGYWVYDQAVERDVLCKTESGTTYIGQVWPGKTAFPDFATAEARAWWGELNADHVKSGLAGIWNDMNEPATGDIPPDAMRFDRGTQPHARFHNQYALLMAMGTTEGLLAALPDKRTFVLSRAGFSGIQRYAANWLGDNVSRWDHLWMSLPMAMGLGLSGQPFIGADIAGFGGDTHAELFARWIQYGALIPFCRNHSIIDTLDQYAWSFGDTIEEIARQALTLRYRLLPYIYSAFMHSSETGAPVQQPLVYAFQSDTTVRDIDDQYLLGSQLLVAPVYTPGAIARSVYLPEGAWYDWWSGEHLNGKRFIVAQAPLDRIPLYARGGALIPMWPEAPASTDGYHPRTIELHLFVPTVDGEYSSQLHEDDGLTFAFRAGASYRTTFTLRRAGNELTLEVAVAGNGYAEFARETFELIFHGAVPDSITADGVAIAANDGQPGCFRVPNHGTNMWVVATMG